MLTTCIFKQPLNMHTINCGHGDFKISVMIDLSLLHPNQLNIDNDCLKRKLKAKKYHTMPYVVFIKGDFVLIDGHHTIASKIIKGTKKVKCLFLSLS